MAKGTECWSDRQVKAMFGLGCDTNPLYQKPRNFVYFIFISGCNLLRQLAVLILVRSREHSPNLKIKALANDNKNILILIQGDFLTGTP